MTAVADLLAWLVRALDGTGMVRERYKLSTQTWNPLRRSDCNLETMVAFLRGWKVTGDAIWRTRSRTMWDGISALQNPTTGSWPFGHTNSAVWTNDNSEAIIYLLRAADLDPDRATAYRAAALATVDWLMSVQHGDGKWPSGQQDTLDPGDFGYPAFMTGHALAALASGYSLASPSTKTAIRAAIDDGAAWLDSVTLSEGRLPAGEPWRPPSSDAAISIRGLALAELLIPNPDPAWTTLRHQLLGWLDGLVDSTGAVRNGYGAGVNNADVWRITDHVYTTAFAAEAYRWSYRCDRDPALRATADSILDFAAGNLYYSGTDPDAYGVLRGAYDLTAQDWDTSEVAQNVGEEGGGDMAYSGWSAAPVAALLLTPLARRRGGIML